MLIVSCGPRAKMTPPVLEGFKKAPGPINISITSVREKISIGGHNTTTLK